MRTKSRRRHYDVVRQSRLVWIQNVGLILVGAVALALVLQALAMQ